jgi:hypothetical protein
MVADHRLSPAYPIWLGPALLDRQRAALSPVLRYLQIAAGFTSSTNGTNTSQVGGSR